MLIQQVSGPGPHANMLKLAEDRHRAYCQRHEILYRVGMGRIMPDMPICYDKPALLLQTFATGHYTYGFWLDSDTFILNDEDMRDALPDGAELGMNYGQSPSREPAHFNVGAIYARNTERVRALLTRGIEEGRRSVKCDDQGKWWLDPTCEQTIINHLLETEYQGLCVNVGPKWNCVQGLYGNHSPMVLAWHGGGDAGARYLRMARDLVMLNLIDVKAV